jgi:hypothetical protein
MDKSYVEIDVSTKMYPGMKCKVDPEDVAMLAGYKWGVTYMGEGNSKLPYARIRKEENGVFRYIRMHRLIMNAPAGVEVDHINGDTLDNRKSNLRFATRLEQSRNTGMRKNNTTGFKGVSQIKTSKRFRAYIVVNRKQINLGVYLCAEEASAAYQEAAKKLFGDFMRA